MKEVAVVSYCRTGIARATRGALNQTHGIPMAAHVMREAVSRAKIEAAEIEDVILGCAMPEAEQGMNVARICALRAGVPDSVPAMTINRFCSSGLNAVSIAADRIRTGEADIMIAAGTESMSMIPMPR